MKKDAPGCTTTRADPETRQSEPPKSDELGSDANGQKITPQSTTIKVIPGKPAEIDFIAHLGDLPVDIYFLFDYSSSMKKGLNDLKRSIKQIVKKVQDWTSDAAFGMGGYLDKPIPPFAYDPKGPEKFKNVVSPKQFERMNKQFDEKKDEIRKVLAYEHYSNISTDETKLTEFLDNFNEDNLGENEDDPESNFDALAQAMVCDKIVGWRGNGIRRVIIMIGDQEPKIAMDGMIAG